MDQGRQMAEQDSDGTVTSPDGTTIAYSRQGSGPPVVLVDGALCHRGAGPNKSLAKLLASDYTVYTYDRRGRGESGDARAYATDREIEDLKAVIDSAGERVYLFGISSGGMLALDAANRLPGIEKLALYELPYVVDDSREPLPPNFAGELDELVTSGHSGEAVSAFMKRGVLVPGVFVALMHLMPAWPRMKRIAHTLVYDVSFFGDLGAGRPLPTDRWTAVTMPTLVAGGSKSPDWVKAGVKGLTQVLPNAVNRTLEGQTHLVKAKALAPVLKEFFG